MNASQRLTDIPIYHTNFLSIATVTKRKKTCNLSTNNAYNASQLTPEKLIFLPAKRFCHTYLECWRQFVNTFSTLVVNTNIPVA